MRTAIISDIHGSLASLDAALKDIEQANIDRIICLGDIVDGGDDNEDVISKLIERNITCVKGNHDEFNNLQLNSDIKDYLLNLPEEIIEQEHIYTHISPRKKRLKIDNILEAWNVFEETNYRLIFIGHVHYPLIFGQYCEEPCSATKYSFNYNEPWPIDINDRYIICIGAVGYGRDLVGKIRYGIYDAIDHSIELRAIDGELLSIDWKNRYQQF